MEVAVVIVVAAGFLCISKLQFLVAKNIQENMGFSILKFADMAFFSGN